MKFRFRVEALALDSIANFFYAAPNGWCVSGEQIERSERPSEARLRIRCTRMLGSPCEDVTPTAWVLCILVRLTFDVLDDLEMSTPKRLDDLAWNMEAEIQGDGRAE
jgi:hypothetical protein